MFMALRHQSRSVANEWAIFGLLDGSFSQAGSSIKFEHIVANILEL